MYSAAEVWLQTKSRTDQPFTGGPHRAFRRCRNYRQNGREALNLSVWNGSRTSGPSRFEKFASNLLVLSQGDEFCVNLIITRKFLHLSPVVKGAILPCGRVLVKVLVSSNNQVPSTRRSLSTCPRYATPSPQHCSSAPSTVHSSEEPKTLFTGPTHPAKS